MVNAVEKQYIWNISVCVCVCVWVCVCSYSCLSYPTCKMLAPYFYLWQVWPYCNICPHCLIKKDLAPRSKYYLINGTIFLNKKLLNTNCVFWFTYIHTSSRKLLIILVQLYWNLNFLDFCARILEYQILWQSVQWEPSCSMWTHTDGWTDGQTDRQTDMSRLVVAFRNFTNEPNMEFSLVYICK